MSTKLFLTNQHETPQQRHNHVFIKKFQNGKYVFKATYPGVYSGRPIPHIHYKVSIICRIFLVPSLEKFSHLFYKLSTYNGETIQTFIIASLVSFPGH
jgi:hypothetical protein